jgi:hypothetical protein
MKTAPKDGTFIQIAYPSFSDNGKVFVGHGRWVNEPPQARVEAYLASFHPFHREFHGTLDVDPHWEVAYVAKLEHGGRWSGFSYEARSFKVERPLGWLPLPTPPKARRS